MINPLLCLHDFHPCRLNQGIGHGCYGLLLKGKIPHLTGNLEVHGKQLFGQSTAGIQQVEDPVFLFCRQAWFLNHRITQSLIGVKNGLDEKTLPTDQIILIKGGGPDMQLL